MVGLVLGGCGLLGSVGRGVSLAAAEGCRYLSSPHAPVVAPHVIPPGREGRTAGGRDCNVYNPSVLFSFNRLRTQSTRTIQRAHHPPPPHLKGCPCTVVALPCPSTKKHPRPYAEVCSLTASAPASPSIPQLNVAICENHTSAITARFVGKTCKFAQVKTL